MLETAKTNMIKQQLRARNVLDEELLQIITATPRELFVPEAYRYVAYADMQIPLPFGEVMMTPYQEAAMLQAVEVTSLDRVLEVGTGTGYVTALLAQQANEVVSVDCHAEFTQLAADNLLAFSFNNITLLSHDAALHGEAKHAPFDVIILTGSLPLLPKAFTEQLKIGGRLFAIIGEGNLMQATLITRLDNQAYDTEFLFATHIKPLQHGPKKPAFQF